MTEEQIEQVTDSNSETLEKTFTQNEVNKIVQERLQRSKKDYEDQIKSIRSLAEDKDKMIEGYEGKLNQLIDKQLGDIPEAVKDLCAKLSVSDKVDWLEKHAEDNPLKGFEKRNIPNTPTGKDSENTFKPNTKNTFKS